MGIPPNEMQAGDAVLEDDNIVFRFPVKFLKSFVKYHPRLMSNGPHGSNTFFDVTDPKLFAKELVQSINHEDREDGSSAFTRFLDDAIEKAIEDGAEGVEEDVE